MSQNTGLTPKFFSSEASSPIPTNRFGKDYKVCCRCVSDTSMPSIRFDKNGVCSYCELHKKMELQYPNGKEGQRIIEKTIKKIKADGKNNKYDCIIGVSGGRDSTFALYNLKNWGLRPLAVHFNDGFGNPVAGENIRKMTEKLNVDLYTVTSDWRESKDLKLSFLKASTPDLENPTDLGIFATLLGAAVKENSKHVVIGNSFRTEGVAPIDWFYYDGKYLNSVHKQFGTVPLRGWKPGDPGFNLNMAHVFYYIIIRRIKIFYALYHMDYVRKEADEILKRELGWENPGAHYYDDLYQSLVFYIHRTKFGIDKRRFNYSALIRSNQMTREEGLKRLADTYLIEDPKVIDLCIKRLGITQENLDCYLARPKKSFMDYPSNFRLIKKIRLPIKLACQLKVLPKALYAKYYSNT